MEATILLKPNELTTAMLDTVKSMVKMSGFTEIRISLSDKKSARSIRKETQEEVNAHLEKVIAQYNAGNTEGYINFTAEEFEQLSNSLLNK